MTKFCATLLLSPLLLLLPGCDRPKTLDVEKMAAPTKTSNIVIDVGEKLAITHEAQAGQTIEWRANSPNTPNFWIQFLGASPCANGALVLSGSATMVASCVAGGAGGKGNGTITYSYYILDAAPPPGATGDRIVRCPAPACNS